MLQVRLSGAARICALALAVAVLVPVTASASTGHSAVAQAIMARLNAIRTAHGLGPLSWCAGLARAAAAHSRDMATNGNFSHASGSGGSFATRIRHYVRAKAVGENLAWVARVSASQEAGMVVNMWMHSPPHRANILSPRYHRIGLGLQGGGLLGGRQSHVVTADFAS